jgi:leucyl/phenylalanyl-tRNA--protein transferase
VTRWRFPDDFLDHPSDLISLGADLEPGTLLAAYSRGLFPMPWKEDAIGWWSPDPRGVILGELWAPNRSLRRARRKFRITVNESFEEVVAGCGDPARPHGWITLEIRAAYVKLHELGWAHSVEARTESGALAGGLYGVAIGGFFAAESKFHRLTDASKAALAGLFEICGPRALIDVQWATSHLARMGVLEIGRAEYLERLAEAIRRPLPEGFGPQLSHLGHSRESGNP